MPRFSSKSLYCAALLVSLTSATSPSLRGADRKLFGLYRNKGQRNAAISSGIGNGSCFPPHATVQVEGMGKVRFDQVRVGDRILTANVDGTPAFAPVVMFLDKEKQTKTPVDYLKITLASGRQIEMTPKHKIYAGATCCDRSSLKEARALKMGDTVHVMQPNAGAAAATRVASIESTQYPAKYDLATTNGDALVVDGVVTTYLTSDTFAGSMNEQELDVIRSRMVGIFTGLYHTDPNIGEDLSAYYRRHNFQTWIPMEQKITAVLARCNALAGRPCDHSTIVSMLGDPAVSMPSELKSRLVSALAAQTVGGMSAMPGFGAVATSVSAMSGGKLSNYLIREGFATTLEDAISAASHVHTPEPEPESGSASGIDSGSASGSLWSSGLGAGLWN